MRHPNPYRPGFNQAPEVMAGREGVLSDVREALEVASYDGRTPRPIVLVGSRGVGKTVTLGEIVDLAGREFSWPGVHVEVKSGEIIGDLVARLVEVTILLEGGVPSGKKGRARVRVVGGKVSAAGFGLGGEVQLERPEVGGDPGEQLQSALSAAMDAAVRAEAGLVVTLDEVHTADAAEFGILAACLQEQVPADWPLVVAMAGLPSLRTNRGKRRLPTYLERAEWHELGPLSDADAERALGEPARLAGRPMTAAAVEVLMETCGGYPYAIQVAGHFAWRASHQAGTITVEHARAALPRIAADLDQLIAGRWADASERERGYLVAVADVARDRAPTGGLVAARLGQPTPKVSYLRERLVKKGTLYVDGAGVLHFITPGMGEWIRHHTT